ncbi:hypothetical protein NE237_029733 [Protea cynaroides]|uniref:RNase H type-1 domain-containing protein n=1 Tax=Protea cynaroides TaxID=273540 RepID=A0A9Q0GTQ4_9MAGN|nr:hypothetical protein NE237_029733 [Protea cynaroides]
MYKCRELSLINPVTITSIADLYTVRVLQLSTIGGKQNKIVELYWQPPMEHWCKVNVDECCLGNSGNAGYGSAIRNSHGKIVLAFYEFIGVATNFVAELHGAILGVSATVEKGYHDIWLESDSKSNCMPIELYSCTMKRNPIPTKVTIHDHFLKQMQAKGKEISHQN